MVGDYISREAALDSICTACEVVPIDEKENCPYKFTGCAFGSVWAIPAADVVEVVRCGECKYDERCMFQSFVESEGVEPYDKSMFFCSDGKRKEGGQDE